MTGGKARLNLRLRSERLRLDPASGPCYDLGGLPRSTVKGAYGALRETTLEEINARVRCAPRPTRFVQRIGGRPREPEEERLLTRIAVRRSRSAVAAGKIQKQGPREWFYAIKD